MRRRPTFWGFSSGKVRARGLDTGLRDLLRSTSENVDAVEIVEERRGKVGTKEIIFSMLLKCCAYEIHVHDRSHS